MRKPPMSLDEATEKYAKKLEPRITAMLAAAKVAETKRSDAYNWAYL